MVQGCVSSPHIGFIRGVRQRRQMIGLVVVMVIVGMILVAFLGRGTFG